MRSRLRLVLSLVALLATSAGHALATGPKAAPLLSVTQEQTAQALFHELRCVVCAGQSLAESNAALAIQMRARIRAMLADKKSSEEILAYFRERYGDQVLMTPPVNERTIMLWGAPALLLLLGGWIAFKHVRQ